MKNSNDNIGNRTRDLPACSVVPQPTVPPRTLTDFIIREYRQEVLPQKWVRRHDKAPRLVLSAKQF
jgi:hypothetical protein